MTHDKTQNDGIDGPERCSNCGTTMWYGSGARATGDCGRTAWAVIGSTHPWPWKWSEPTPVCDLIAAMRPVVEAALAVDYTDMPFAATSKEDHDIANTFWQAVEAYREATNG